MTASVFSVAELAYLSERRLGRLATADGRGRPQVTPVGMWSHNAANDSIEVRGRDFESTKKFRNVTENPYVAFVVDDMAESDEWHPRAVIVEGPAAAIPAEGTDTPALIRIAPERVISWGLTTAK
jgi:pyridoxamine 5'-phosphate oxidase family protein